MHSFLVHPQILHVRSCPDSIEIIKYIYYTVFTSETPVYIPEFITVTKGKYMNPKPKRILAIIGIIILAGLYITTLLLAIFGDDNTTPWFMASICATIIVPVLLWVYTWLYNRLKSDVEEARNKEKDQSEDS